MNELARHIELLLLENDCVILPHLGGLITHYVPAQQSGDSFLPPSRIIAFNPQLTMNDGLLAQSYMTHYATDFVDATRHLMQDIHALLDVLYADGRVELPAIGALTCDIHDNISFSPFERTLATPTLFGLDAFNLAPLAAASTARPRRLSRLPRVAAILIGFILLFLFSTPTDRHASSTLERAEILPVELLKPVDSVRPAEPEPSAAPAAPSAPAEPSAPAATAAPKRFHIIVASLPGADDARRMARQLTEKGYSEAQAIIGNNRNRVAAFSFATRAEAYNALRRITADGTFVNAWVLKH